MIYGKKVHLILQVLEYEGESVSVHYWRNNKECTTEIALDMNLPNEKETESYYSLTDELERIVSLI